MELECRRFKRRMLLGRHNLEQDLVREVRDETWMHLCEVHLAGAPAIQLKSPEVFIITSEVFW